MASCYTKVKTKLLVFSDSYNIARMQQRWIFFQLLCVYDIHFYKDNKSYYQVLSDLW